MASAAFPHRGRYTGLIHVVRFNWPQYVLGLAVTVALALLAAWSLVPWLGRIVFVLGAGLALWWILASMAASHYIYDHSPLYRWDWLRARFPESPGRWITLHAGFDETSDALRALFPQTSAPVVDFYDPSIMTETSIARAQALRRWQTPSSRATVSDLGLERGSFDAVFLILAAHEIRDHLSGDASSDSWGRLWRREAASCSLSTSGTCPT